MSETAKRTSSKLLLVSLGVYPAHSWNVNTHFMWPNSTWSSHVFSKAADLWPQSPPHAFEVGSCMRKNINVVDFTPWQLTVCLTANMRVVRLHVHVHSTVAFWINKQEVAFICHSRINLLQQQRREQRPLHWPQVCAESCHLFCNTNIENESWCSAHRKWQGWWFLQIVTIFQQ